MLFLPLTILFVVVAAVAAFIAPALAWGILAVPALCLVGILWSCKRRRWHHVPAISDAANALVQRYGHFYNYPFAARDFSSSASLLQLSALALVIPGIVQGFYWSIPFGIIFATVLANVARGFNPTVFLNDEGKRAAHREILAYMESQNGGARKHS